MRASLIFMVFQHDHPNPFYRRTGGELTSQKSEQPIGRSSLIKCNLAASSYAKKRKLISSINEGATMSRNERLWNDRLWPAKRTFGQTTVPAKYMGSHRRPQG